MRLAQNTIVILALAALLGGCGTVEGDPSVCEEEETLCGGTCIDPSSNDTFCGAGLDCEAEPGTTCDDGQACVAGACQNLIEPLSEPTYDPEREFAETAAISSIVGLAFDGTDFWSCAGGGVTGIRMARYDRLGGLVESFAPGVDFRACFTRVPGRAPVLARAFQSDVILVQTSPGVFAPQLTLTGAALNDQSTVVFDGERDEFVAQTNGVLQRWNAEGVFEGTIELEDWGVAVPGEDGAGADGQRVAVSGGLYLTYHNGTLSAFDIAGARIGTTQLVGAGQSADANLSISVADGLVWIGDLNAGDGTRTWRGYDVGL